VRDGRDERGSEPLVRAEGLGHVYKTGSSQVVALQGLDLELRRAETIAVVGPSGSGKTTLINILAALQRPSHGRVSVAGHDLTAIGEREREDYRRRVVGYLWQQSERGLWEGLSVADNVQVPLLAEAGSRRERRDRALELLDLQGPAPWPQAQQVELLDLLGLGPRGRALVDELDYGERQRLALAVALANRPQLLLCDEPTAELDGPSAQALLTELSELLDRLSIGAVVVTHDPQLERYVDRVVRIRDTHASNLPLGPVAMRQPSLRALRQEAGRA
jgi:ABC-type lipoprotein export system ATPase subunit